MRTLKNVIPVFTLSLTLLAGCSDSPTPAGPNNPSDLSASFARQPRDLPDVVMDRPPKPRAWDTSDAELVAAIRAAGGRATIAIKERGSARALATGLRKAVTASTVNAGLAMLRTEKVEILQVLGAVGGAIVRIDPTLAPKLRSHPLVDFLEPDQRMELSTTAGFAEAAVALAQSTPWGITMVRAPQAWTITRGAGVKIQLIDTGHEQNHPDLPAVPSSNCAGSFGGCDDAGLANHGSHVLGIWTARDNALGVVGVAPAITGPDTYVYGACSSTSGTCSSTEVTAGINSAIFNAKVINLSLSGPFDAGTSAAVGQAWGNNIVIVAAAGNNLSNTIVYPAGYTNVLGISGVNQNKSFAASGTTGCSGYSNYGSHVDLAAPFSALSSVPGGTYGTKCGTSMATPHVAGAAALVRAKNPSWTNQQVVTQLLNTAEDRGPAGWDSQFGRGIVDAAKAVGYVDPFFVTATVPEWISVKSTYPLNGSASHPATGWKWERSDNGGATWGLWANAQNSQFVAYAGGYTIHWRLTARRVSDGVTGTDVRATIVCIGTTCGPIP